MKNKIKSKCECSWSKCKGHKGKVKIYLYGVCDPEDRTPWNEIKLCSHCAKECFSSGLFSPNKGCGLGCTPKTIREYRFDPNKEICY